MLTEEWRTVPGFSLYEASSLGRIRRPIHWNTGKLVNHIMKFHPTDWGYYSLSLMNDDGDSKSMLVHTIIALTFIGAKPSLLHIIAHWDNNGHNNTPDNLRWATHKENDDDKNRHGTRPIGLGNGNAKISDDDVLIIRNAYKSGAKQKDIAEIFNIDNGTVSRICNNKRRQLVL